MKLNQRFFWLPLCLIAFFLSIPAHGFDDNPYVYKKRFIENKDKIDPKAQINADLIYRVAFSRADDVKIVLDKGADANAKNPRGLQALYVALIRKDDEAPKIVEELIKHGANPNARTDKGDLPIIEAVKRGRGDVLQLLIDNKAVMGNIRDADNYDLLSLAQRRGDEEIIRIVKTGLESEAEKIKTLRSDENFVGMMQEYSYLQCANEYLNYYARTEKEKVTDTSFDKVIAENNADIDGVLKRFQLIFRINENRLIDVKNYSRMFLAKQLDELQNNRNRTLNGFGSDDDLNKRCWKIAKKWDKKAVAQQGLSYSKN